MQTPDSTIDMDMIHAKVKKASPRFTPFEQSVQAPMWVENPLLPGLRLNVQPLFALIHSRYQYGREAPCTPSILVHDMLSFLDNYSAFAVPQMHSEDIARDIALLCEYARAFTAMMDAQPPEA